MARDGRRLGCDVNLSMCNWSPVVEASKSIVVIHDVLERDFRDMYTASYRYSRAGYLRAIRQSDAGVVTVSEKSRIALESVLQRPVDVVPGGVNVPTLDNLEATRSRVNDELLDRDYALFIGAHDARKNLEFCLRLLPFFESRNMSLCVTARRNGSGFSSIGGGHVAQAMESSAVVVLMDPSDDDLAGLYANARVLVHPSLAEGFGLPLLEAMAWGTPFVSTDCGVARSIAPDERMIQPLRVLDWERALSSQLDAGRSSSNDLRRAAEKWSWSNAARSLLTICERKAHDVHAG